MKRIEEQLAHAVQEVEEGNTSALELYAKLKDLEKFVKKCYVQVENSAIDEFDNEAGGAKSINNFKGYKIESRSGGWSWDFSGIEVFGKKTAELKGLGEKYKTLFLHSDCIDVETGEVLDIQRKPRKDSYIFKKID